MLFDALIGLLLMVMGILMVVWALTSLGVIG